MPLLREATTADFERLWQIDQACFDAELAYSRAELRFYIKLPAAFTLVAENNDEICGFVVGRRARGSTGHIITIDVLKGVRRAGLGSLLLSAAEARLGEMHCRSVTLETAVDNIAAISFYQRHGYGIMRTLPRYYSNGLDALEMLKDLV